MFVHHRASNKLTGSSPTRRGSRNASRAPSRSRLRLNILQTPASSVNSISEQHVDAQDPLGCLGDVGWYCIRFGWPLNYKPAYVRARVWEATDGGVPTDMDCDVSFLRGDPERTVLSRRLLTFHCSFHHHLRQCRGDVERRPHCPYG